MRPDPPTRRGALLGTAGVALVAHCTAPAVARSTPLRIGLLTSLSGPVTSLGETMRAGLEVLIADAGGQMGGRLVELLVEDDGGKPAEGLRKVRKLMPRPGSTCWAA